MRIAIDCEFSFDKNNDFVCICAAVTQEDGITQTWWRDQMYELSQYLKMHKADTFVAHNIDCNFLINLVQNLGEGPAVMGYMAAFTAIVEVPVMMFAMGYPSERSKPNAWHFKRMPLENFVTEL